MKVNFSRKFDFSRVALRALLPRKSPVRTLHTVVRPRIDPMAFTVSLDDVYAKIESIVQRDVGGRGIGALTLQGELERAASAFMEAKRVVVLTGFPCRMNDDPPTETDGPPGAVAIARAALKLGKPAAIATDESSAAVLRACAEAAGLSSLGDFSLHAFPPRASWTTAAEASLQALIRDYDHAVAIERAGRSADGSFYTMRAFKMDHLVAPIDELLTAECACGIGEDAVYEPPRICVDTVRAGAAGDASGDAAVGTSGASTGSDVGSGGDRDRSLHRLASVSEAAAEREGEEEADEDEDGDADADLDKKKPVERVEEGGNAAVAPTKFDGQEAGAAAAAAPSASASAADADAARSIAFPVPSVARAGQALAAALSGGSTFSPTGSVSRRSAVPFRGDVWSRAMSVSDFAAISRTSTGIGDGGNECGMGKVVDAVRAHIPRGDTIACVVPADNLLAVGVSNWGGWALAAAVEALARFNALPAAEAAVRRAASAAAAKAGPASSAGSTAAAAVEPQSAAASESASGAADTSAADAAAAARAVSESSAASESGSAAAAGTASPLGKAASSASSSPPPPPPRDEKAKSAGAEADAASKADADSGSGGSGSGNVASGAGSAGEATKPKAAAPVSSLRAWGHWQGLPASATTAGYKKPMGPPKRAPAPAAAAAAGDAAAAAGAKAAAGSSTAAAAAATSPARRVLPGASSGGPGSPTMVGRPRRASSLDGGPEAMAAAAAAAGSSALALVRAAPPGQLLLPSEGEERAVADAMIASGARDGITGALDGSVDGMPLTTHLDVLSQIRDVLAECFGPAFAALAAADGKTASAAGPAAAAGAAGAGGDAERGSSASADADAGAVGSGAARGRRSSA